MNAFLKKNTSMITLILLVAACGYLAWNNYSAGGTELAKAGILGGGKFLLGIMPMIVVFSLLAGQINAYYQHRPDHVRSVVAGDSVLKAAIAGTCTPGGTTVGQVLQQEWGNGGNKYSIIGCFLAISLLNWTTLLFRLPFFGGKLTLIVFAVGVLITGACVAILTLLQRTHPHLA